jgi:DUF971 family protein
MQGAADGVDALGPDVETIHAARPVPRSRVFVLGSTSVPRFYRGALPEPRALNMSEVPTNIRALQPDQVLELTWEDGRVTRLPYRYLRGECPCAACQDEWTGKRILDPSSIREDLKIEGMEPIGNYAVRLGWNDGHSSGLYTWETLHRLTAQCPS